MAEKTDLIALLCRALTSPPHLRVMRNGYWPVVAYFSGWAQGVGMSGKPYALWPFGQWAYTRLGYSEWCSIPLPDILLSRTAEGNEARALSLFLELLLEFRDRHGEIAKSFAPPEGAPAEIHFVDFLRAFLKRPQMYMTPLTYDTASTYLLAFSDGRKACGRPSEIRAFAEWLKERAGFDGERPWSEFILHELAAGDEDVALAKLLELFGEFVEQVDRGTVSIENQPSDGPKADQRNPTCSNSSF